MKKLRKIKFFCLFAFTFSLLAITCNSLADMTMIDQQSPGSPEYHQGYEAGFQSGFQEGRFAYCTGIYPSYPGPQLSAQPNYPTPQPGDNNNGCPNGPNAGECGNGG